jgi:hypothetical protein
LICHSRRAFKASIHQIIMTPTAQIINDTIRMRVKWEKVHALAEENVNMYLTNAIEFYFKKCEGDKHDLENKFNSILNNVVAKYDIQKAEEKQKKLEQYNKLKLELGL